MRHFSNGTIIIYIIFLIMVIGACATTYWALTKCDICYEMNPLMFYNGYLGIIVSTIMLIIMGFAIYIGPYTNWFQLHLSDLQFCIGIGLLVGTIIRAIDFFHNLILMLQLLST